MRSIIISVSFLANCFLSVAIASNAGNGSNSSCGLTATSIRKPLIVNGVTTISAGQWPWHASIWHRVTRSTHVYVCGGSLLSELYLVTSGHCVSKDGNALNERLVSIQLGSIRQNLLLNGFPVQNLQVAEIFVHKDFVPRTFQADLALVALGTQVMVNEFVKPVCLPDAVATDKDIVGRQAVAVGFGQTESGDNSDVLRQLWMPVVDYLSCLESNREVFGMSLSAAVLCAGNTNGSTVCNGDSGGGLFTQESDGRWVIRGVTSFTAQRGWNDSSCSLSDYAAFVNVAHYGDWIKYVMTHGEQEGFFGGTAGTGVKAVTAKPVKPELRISEKHCKLYRRKGLVVTGSDGPSQIYLFKDRKSQGLAYYLTKDYAITTAVLAIDCVYGETVCQTILGYRIRQTFIHPEYRGGRDFNVAVLLIPPADEPL
ncbi:chymotrypsinogen B-like isoform X2 [Wyeomyia smithii]|nr:chymotrypsinogen B-like isoform X2 [Wyeomyia smithii]